METFKVSLSNQYDKKPKYQPYYFIILGVFYIIIGMLNLTKSNSDYFSGWIWIITGIGFVIASFFSRNITKKNFLELNDKAIIAYPSFNKKINIAWNNLEQIHIKPIAFDFILKDGSTESISLGNLAYKDVIETKEKLKEFAIEHNIKLQS